MSSNFVMPKQIISGAGALNDAKDVFKKAGKKALIVSGKVMEKVGTRQNICRVLIFAQKKRGLFWQLLQKYRSGVKFLKNFVQKSNFGCCYFIEG